MCLFALVAYANAGFLFGLDHGSGGGGGGGYSGGHGGGWDSGYSAPAPQGNFC